MALPGDIAGAGLYGTAIATMGMLAPCAYILAMDTFGPITDNAGGIIEMSKQPEEVRQQDRPARRRRQHHESADQGLRHRLGRPRRVPALQRLPGRGPQDHRTARSSVDLTRRARLRGRPARRHAGLRLQRPRHQGRGQGGAGGDQRGAPAVQGEPRHHGRNLQARLRALRGHRHRGRAARDGRARGSSPCSTPVVVGFSFRYLSGQRPDRRRVGGGAAHGRAPSPASSWRPS